MCNVLGVSVGPLIKEEEKRIVIDEFEMHAEDPGSAKFRALAISIILTWEKSFQPLLHHFPESIGNALRTTPWLSGDLWGNGQKELFGGVLSIPRNAGKNCGSRPLDLWLMPGSDYSDLLNRVFIKPA